MRHERPLSSSILWGKNSFKSVALTCSSSYILAVFHKYQTGNFKVNRSADLYNLRLFRQSLFWAFHMLQIVFICSYFHKLNIIWCIMLHNSRYGNLKWGVRACMYMCLYILFERLNTKLTTEPYFPWEWKK